MRSSLCMPQQAKTKADETVALNVFIEAVAQTSVFM